MRKTILAALATLMLLTVLGGCQLAVNDDELNPEADRLCGVFVTLDYLNVGFEDQEIELPTNWNGDLNNIVFPETRIYATRTEAENGHVDYIFDGVEGFRFFVVQVDSSDGSGSYSASYGDSAIQDGHIEISNEDVNLSGTIYFDTHTPIFQIYANPVYQTPDGEVYMTSGSGVSLSGDQSAGTSCATSLSDTTTENNNGEETSRTTKVEIKAEAVNTNTKVVLKQMDSNDQIIMQTEMTPDAIPESIDVLQDTAYMIMEEHCIDYENKASVKRTLVKTDEVTLSARFTGDNNIVESYPITLEYAGEKESSLL